MSRSSFLSIVVPVCRQHTIDDVSVFVARAAEQAGNVFSDYEIILVDNRSGLDFESVDASQESRKNCYLVKLSNEVIWDIAVLAGLERANGDYVLTMDMALSEILDRTVDLYDLAQKGSDITYVKSATSARHEPWQRRIFYMLMRRLGRCNVDARALRCFLFSRRAVNTVMRRWTTTTFLNEAAFSSGYSLREITVERAESATRRDYHDEHRLAWAALTRHANFPLLLGQAAVMIMGAICVGSAVNAVMVRFFERNIFGAPEEYVPGWPFMVVLVSGGLLLTNIAIYAVLRTLYFLIEEKRGEAHYLVERYGRV